VRSAHRTRPALIASTTGPDRRRSAEQVTRARGNSLSVNMLRELRYLLIFDGSRFANNAADHVSAMLRPNCDS
jgi:hypothetical protein